MAQLPLFEIATPPHSYDVAITPEIERALAELLVLRRGPGGLLARWRQRWENNKQRYARLECVRVIMPWSSAGARFCTSELKTAIACRALAKRFVGRPILSVTGIRRAESAARSKAPVCTPQQRLVRKRGLSFNSSAKRRWVRLDLSNSVSR
jgi:hypothetical protein